MLNKRSLQCKLKIIGSGLQEVQLKKRNTQHSKMKDCMLMHLQFIHHFSIYSTCATWMFSYYSGFSRLQPASAQTML